MSGPHNTCASYLKHCDIEQVGKTEEITCRGSVGIGLTMSVSFGLLQ